MNFMRTSLPSPLAIYWKIMSSYFEWCFRCPLIFPPLEQLLSSNARVRRWAALYFITCLMLAYTGCLMLALIFSQLIRLIF